MTPHQQACFRWQETYSLDAKPLCICEILEETWHDGYATGLNDERMFGKPNTDERPVQERLLEFLQDYGWQSELEHADDCDRAKGCTCGTRTIAQVEGDNE